MITVFGADDTTVLSTHAVGLNKSIISSTDSSESAPIGAVNWSEISGEFWTGILQSVTFSTPDPTPEPASLSLLGIGVLTLAGMVRRKLIR
jgi:PEP-CTERM motif-containing protein